MRVCEPSGFVWRFLPQSQVLALARAEAVYGKGSLARLKYCVLQVPAERAEEIISDSADKLHSSQASKTTRIARGAVERDGRTFQYTIHQHHARCFTWHGLKTQTSTQSM